MASYRDRLKVVEVSPRDGLQAEPATLDTATKIALIDRLSETGLSVIEVTGFVNPRQVPQLADAEAVWSGIRRARSVTYPVLVPNLHGLQRAVAVGVQQIAVFTSASQTFCEQNLNCSVEASLARYAAVIERAAAQGISVRAYISCALGCPYEGDVPVADVVNLARHFIEAGCFEVALGDTIGAGTPLRAGALVHAVAQDIPLAQVAVHFHDTRGQALANVLACLERGVRVVDASVAGLGGCPFAPGAAGNLATEDLVFMLHGMGIETGIDLPRLIDVGRFISGVLGRRNHSRVGVAGMRWHGLSD